MHRVQPYLERPVILSHLIPLQFFYSAHAFHSLAPPSSSLPAVKCSPSYLSSSRLATVHFASDIPPAVSFCLILPDIVYSVLALFHLCSSHSILSSPGLPLSALFLSLISIYYAILSSPSPLSFSHLHSVTLPSLFS